MIKTFLIIWSAVKTLLKIIFWLLFIALLVIFTLWFIGKFHPVFDMGIERFILNIINSIKSFIGLR